MKVNEKLDFPKWKTKTYPLKELEEIMEKSHVQTLPRWAFMILSIGGAWASGIYLGKISIVGVSTDLLIPLFCFGIIGLIMAWGAIGER